MSTKITVDELLYEYQKLAQKTKERPSNVFTTKELRELLGYGRERTLDFIRICIQEGYIEITKVQCLMMNGVTSTKTAWLLKPVKSTKGKK